MSIYKHCDEPTIRDLETRARGSLGNKYALSIRVDGPEGVREGHVSLPAHSKAEIDTLLGMFRDLRKLRALVVDIKSGFVVATKPLGGSTLVWTSCGGINERK